MDPEFRESILRRDGYRCQAPIVGYAIEVACCGRLHVHHRELSTKRDTPENCVTLCMCHHRHAHDVDRAGAEHYGLITRRAAVVPDSG